MALGVGLVQVGATLAIAHHHGVARPWGPPGVVLLAAGPAALLVRRRYPVAALLRGTQEPVRPTWQVPAVVTAAVIGLALVPIGSDWYRAPLWVKYLVTIVYVPAVALALWPYRGKSGRARAAGWLVGLWAGLQLLSLWTWN